MGKIKTHKGTKKILNVRNSGTIGINHQGKRHNTGKKNTAFNRNKRKGTTLNHSDFKRIKEVI